MNIYATIAILCSIYYFKDVIYRIVVNYPYELVSALYNYLYIKFILFYIKESDIDVCDKNVDDTRQVPDTLQAHYNSIIIKSTMGYTKSGNRVYMTDNCSNNYEIMKSILEFLLRKGVYSKTSKLITGVSENDDNEYTLRKTSKFLYYPEDVIQYDGMEFKYNESKHNSDDMQMNNWTSTIIKIKTKKQTSEINKFIKNCYDEYIDIYYKYAVEDEEKNKIYYYMMVPNESSRDNTILFKRYEMKHKKTIDDVFFPEKDQLIDNLDEFASGNLTFPRYSLLLHGKPGCGKTTIVKAICSRYKLNVINIKLSQLESIYQLIDVFHNDRIQRIGIEQNEYDKIHHSKRLYLFEDIDAETSSVLKRKDMTLYSTNSNAEQINNDGKLLKNQESKINKINEFTKSLYPGIRINEDYSGTSSIYGISGSSVSSQVFDKKSLTLSEILNMLDGVLELTDCIIIMTTNRVEKLDPALIRPGRINMSIELKSLTFPDFVQIIKKNISGIELSNNVKKQLQRISVDYVVTGSLLESCCQNVCKICKEQQSYDMLVLEILKNLKLSNDDKKEILNMI